MLFMKEDACLVPVLRNTKTEALSIMIEVHEAAWFAQVTPVLGIYTRGLPLICIVPL